MRYVGLVRNVMVGREGLSRDVLLRLLTDSGARDGASHLTTGNVTFDATPSRLSGVVRRLETGLAEVIGRPEPVIVRSADEVAALVASDPFRGLSEEEWNLEAAFLPRTAPPLDPARAPVVEGVRIVSLRPHELLAAARRGERSPGINKILERAAGQRATARGWSTLVRLAAVHPGVEASSVARRRR